jgi:hypothetical protein
VYPLRAFGASRIAAAGLFARALIAARLGSPPSRGLVAAGPFTLVLIA